VADVVRSDLEVARDDLHWLDHAARGRSDGQIRQAAAAVLTTGHTRSHKTLQRLARTGSRRARRRRAAARLPATEQQLDH
jgi:hypothetical protein